MSIRLIYRISIIAILTSLIILGTYMVYGEYENAKNKKQIMPQDSFAYFSGEIYYG